MMSLFHNTTSTFVDLIIEGDLTAVGKGTIYAWTAYFSFIADLRNQGTFLDLVNNLAFKQTGSHYWAPSYAFLGGMMRN